MTIAPKAFGEPKVSPEVLLDTLFRPMGVDGVYGRTARYEGVVEALAALISRHREPGAEILRFPPVVSRALIEKSGYLKSFPHLLGCVCSLSGGEREIGAAVDRFVAGQNWTDALSTGDLVLAPAACYPVYPMAAAAGPIPADGLTFDVACDCFRREPSKLLDRLQSFRMREYVCIGTPEHVDDFRRRWMVRAEQMAVQLGLPYRIEQASDAFFGRGSKLMAMSQIEQALKFELVVPIRAEGPPTACMSFNYHRDHFGAVWNLCDAAGQAMHTGCVAFGMDRLVLALFAIHGLDYAWWPAAVRKALDI